MTDTVATVRDSGPVRGPAPQPRFVDSASHADVAVVIVCYNSADHLPTLLQSLRGEAADARIRVVIVDNESTDDTVSVAATHAGVIVLRSGGNLGYAGGINVALAELGSADSVFIVNPDLVIERGCIAALRERMRQTGAAVVVPRILDEHNHVYPSLRREPTIARALGDAAFGSALPNRSGRFSEMVQAANAYRSAHLIEWATGAALLIRRDVADAIGDWDERFFLYSEETDFFRRVRDVGGRAWFEPRANVRHFQGGSGSSVELDTLQAVNRVRYARKHHSRAWAAGFRVATIAHEVARSYQPSHRHALRALLRESSWSHLPRARYSTLTVPGGVIIIPAHNEATVIGRTLERLAPLAQSGIVEVVVACNGCTDETAAIARSYPAVRVIEVLAASKTAALNAADEAVSGWPRLYLDADIELDASSINAVFAALSDGVLLAARPAFRYDTTGAHTLVRSYYRARSRMASTTTSALWGAGVYALNKRGHARFGRFPSIVADDLWVDTRFTAAEKTIVQTSPARVRTPRTPSALLAVLSRTYRGNAESDATAAAMSTSRVSVGELVSSVRGPASASDAVVYLGFALAGRLTRIRRRSAAARWERDESSRRGVLR